jgi:beta-mannosidase
LPVFAKGANYIPTHFFIPTGSRDPQTYEILLQSAVDANFNMLRVWGGGHYELDLFYDLADRMGLMLWHDFMFANSLYPPTQDFLKNVKEEVTEQLQRLRNHPSIVFWCGNNEIGQGLREWGWSNRHKSTIDMYTEIFEQTIPQLLNSYSPDPNYIPTSPMAP